MDKIRSLKEAKEAANPEDANKADGEESTVEEQEQETVPEMPTFTTEAVIPTSEGSWMRMPIEWEPRKVLL